MYLPVNGFCEVPIGGQSMGCRGKKYNSDKQRKQYLKGAVKSTKNKLIQQSINEPRITSETDSGNWGDEMTADAPDNVWRVGFQNIGPQRLNPTSAHATRTVAHIKAAAYHAFLFAEHSLHLPKVSAKQSWESRI
jgi:hypothetical protein